MKKPSGLRVPMEVLVALKILRGICTLEKAAFGLPTDKVVWYSAGGKREYTPTGFVKEITDPHRRTWMLPLLDRIIAWAQGHAQVGYIREITGGRNDE